MAEQLFTDNEFKNRANPRALTSAQQHTPTCLCISTYTIRHVALSPRFRHIHNYEIFPRARARERAHITIATACRGTHTHGNLCCPSLYHV